MNIKTLAIAGACGVAWGIGVLMFRKMSKSYKNDVDNAIYHATYNEFGEDLSIARNDLTLARAESKIIERTEIDTVKETLSTNTEYLTAKATAEAGKKQLDILKKNLKAAQAGNTTSVAAANGNQSVAVSIKDTSQIAQIQSDISKLEAEIKQNEITRDTIWRVERKSVMDKRTPEDIAVFNKVKDAEKHLNKVKFESELYKNNLRKDPNFMYEVESKAYLKYYTPAKQIIGMLLISIPAIAALTWGWWFTIRNVKTYIAIKKGVY